MSLHYSLGLYNGLYLREPPSPPPVPGPSAESHPTEWAIFKAIDTDQNGLLDLNELFEWGLLMHSKVTGYQSYLSWAIALASQLAVSLDSLCLSDSECSPIPIDTRTTPGLSWASPTTSTMR